MPKFNECLSTRPFKMKRSVQKPKRNSGGKQRKYSVVNWK